ncbi:MAG: hypothetical protein KDB00_04505 [Planctomycetales bacterium]|nr:hypothetical protein [Planctomycetales bacterium]
MSIAQSEFWSRLVQSGLADDASCQRYAAAFSKSLAESSGGNSTGDGETSPPDAGLVDAKRVAGFLVRTGVVNKFQAARLITSEAPALRVGSFVMAGDQPIQPFSHWIPAQTDASEGEPVRRGVLLRVPLASLDEGVRSWLAAHSEVQAETLQAIELRGGAQAGDADQMVEIFSPLPDGGSLLKVLESKQSLSSRKTVRIGVDLANALQALHSSAPAGVSMAHGAVGADHVWVTPRGNAVLLRDPSSPARSPRADQSGSWIERIEPPALYAAPELADPTVAPSPKSDVYSLGCLLFSLLVGRPAFSGRDENELFGAHRAELPQELIDAVDQGASGNAMLRVLAYAMAKDPAARFASAASFADALIRAGEVIEDQKTTKADRSKSKSKKNKKASSETQVKVPAESSAERPADSQPISPPPKATPPTVAPPVSRPPAFAVPPEQAPSVSVSPPDAAPIVAVPAAAPTKRPSAKGLSAPPTEPPEPVAIPVAAGTSNSKTATSKIAATDLAADAPVVDEAVVNELRDSASPTVDTESSSVAEETSTESDASRRRRRKRRKNRLPILAGMMVLPVLMLGLAIALRGRGPAEPPPRPRPSAGIAGNVPRVPDSRRDVGGDEPTVVNGYEIVDSDRLLWVPPYAADSTPPSLELLPPGPAVIVSVPIAHVVSSTDAEPMTSTFAGEIDSLIAIAEKRSGVSKQQMARCTVALFPGKNGWPEVALAIELTEPLELNALAEKWNAQESRVADGAIVYAGEEIDGDAFFIGGGQQGKLGDGEKVRRFAVGSLNRIREVAEAGGAAIPLVRSMATLWNETSNQSDFVALVTPNFLFADGREMISSTVPEFRSQLKQWLIPDVAAFTLSATVKDGALYVELREVASGGATSATLLKSFRESIDAWPAWGDEFILRSVPDPSWRLLATRLPLMLRFVGQQTRGTIIGETVVASAYLPADAGAQVALATLLAMNTVPGGAVVADTPTAKPLSVDEMLDRPMSISFLQLSLQFAVDAVAEEFGQSLPAGSTMPKVRIIGGDLEKNGITQNQQISGFQRDDIPLRTVLTDLVLGANPDKTATGPADPKQSLVWVVFPAGKSPEETEILITTRDAAAGKYELPKEFRLADE